MLLVTTKGFDESAPREHCLSYLWLSRFIPYCCPKGNYTPIIH